MKRKIFLVCIVVILTVINFRLFEHFYHSKIKTDYEKNIAQQLTNN